MKTPCEEDERCPHLATHRALLGGGVVLLICEEHAYPGDLPLHHLTPTNEGQHSD